MFVILSTIKPTNQMAGRLFFFFQTVFDTTFLIGKYFLSGYLWAIAPAMLQSTVAGYSQATAVPLKLSLAYSLAIATSELGHILTCRSVPRLTCKASSVFSLSGKRPNEFISLQLRRPLKKKQQHTNGY